MTAVSAQPDLDATDARTEPPTVTPSLLDAVRDLRRDVERTAFPLEVPGVEEARASRSRLLDQLSDHLLPRLEQLSAPAVVVLAGSTGAGKSTLANSLLGTEVSAAGVLRPTTRRPVLVHHPDDGDLLAGHPLMGAVDVVPHDGVPRGIALLDAPDLDSVLASNRETAHRLLEAADLWLFVTTAARYGDALPWRVLDGAMQRTASVAMVLNRVPPESLATVRGDLLTRLRERGMHGVPLFVVPDVGPHEGLLEPSAVAPIQRWLTTVAGPDRARSVIARTLRGSLGSLRSWVDSQAEAVQAQVDAAAALRVQIAAAVAGPAAVAGDAVVAGTVADGGVRASWAELTAGAGPLARAIGRSGRLRGSRRAGRTRETALAPLLEHLERSAAATLDAAATAAETALRTRLTAPDAPPGAAALVAGWATPDRDRARTQEAQRSAHQWVRSADDAVADLVASGDPATARRAQAAVAALGARGLAAVLLAAAAGLAPAGQLMHAALGDAGVPVREALRDGLVARAREQVSQEAASLERRLAVPDLAPDAASRLRLRLAVLKGLT
jgi:energy-coupling factor transporter ATP-binding protein EcfA2